MPIASSSAMCLSRATGSRPVQPATTACSMRIVIGLAEPPASTMNSRSTPDDIFNPGGQFKNTSVRTAGSRQHQTDRHLALAMRRQRNGAAVDHVDQGAIAQTEHVRPG